MEKTIFNCHTHIFTIDHVPDKFGKKLIPLFLYHLVTMKVLKWYYHNFTGRKNIKIRQIKHQLQKYKYHILDFLKFLVLPYYALKLSIFFIKWALGIVTGFFKMEFLFSDTSKATFRRFLTLGRYSLYDNQGKIFGLLERSYQEDSSFVVLAMDMDYMGAGKPAIPYLDQLEELRRLKQRRKQKMHPFLFLDPRRIADTKHLEGNDNYENLAKSLLRSGQFSGIKMYPALGYYPFDKDLISMYKYALQYDIPIMTHCIKGTVFYRGKKKKEWNHHPILSYNKEAGVQVPIPLPQKDNYSFTTNFTHPLNYYCLLNPELLKLHMGDAWEEGMDFSKLKICLAHFGGEDEWRKYQLDSWNKYNKNISHDSVDEYLKYKNTLNHENKRTIWWNASWLAVIYDLMVCYENVYTDVSFILHDESLFPLLKFILNDDKVKHKVLFGSDYYVVSQKDTEKDLFVNLKGYLGDDIFHMISNTNPRRYLNLA